MQSNKCIVFLTPGFPANENDTSCIPAIQDFFNSWSRNIKTEDIFILTFQYPFKRGWYKWNGIDVYSAGGKNSIRFLKIVCWTRIIFQLYKLQRTHKIKMLFSFWLTETAFVAWIFSFFYQTKLYCYLFGQDATADNKYLRILPLKKIKVIANSAFTAAEFYKTTKRGTHVTIPLGLDVYHLALEKTKLNYDIIGVGSLHAIKNFNMLVDIIAEVKKHHHHIKAIIAGGGSYDVKLNKKIAHLNLQESITLTGEVSRQKVFELLSSSQIMLHTSSYESFCMARVEAFYAGCSVVTFRNGYIINHEDFITVETKEEMTEVILNLLAQEKERTNKKVRTMDECVNEVYALLCSG